MKLLKINSVAQKANRIVGALMLVGLCLLCAGCFGHEPSLLQQAEELTRQDRIDDAINLYQEHIQTRLAVKDRPEWENPYFYLLIIGDLNLRSGRVEQALLAFNHAETEGVDRGLVSDRYRSVASWHERSGQLDLAISILIKYRDRDQLLFDSMLDRIAREKVKREDLAGATGAITLQPTPNGT